MPFQFAAKCALCHTFGVASVNVMSPSYDGAVTIHRDQNVCMTVIKYNVLPPEKYLAYVAKKERTKARRFLTRRLNKLKREVGMIS